MDYKPFLPTPKEYTTCDRISQWCFMHSTPTGESSYDGDQIYCSCLNCCPGNLELKLSDCNNKNDKVVFCCCFTLMFL